MIMLRSRDFNAGTCSESLFPWTLESWNIISIGCQAHYVAIYEKPKPKTRELFQVYGTTSGEICGCNQAHFTHETNSPPTLTGVGHQWTVSISTGCDQWFSLARLILKMAHVGRNRSPMVNSYTPHTRWCRPPVNGEYQNWLQPVALTG